MRKASVVAVAFAVILSASGCWPQPGFDAGRSRWNPYERRITPGNVHEVTEVWDTPAAELGGDAGDLMALGDGVFVTGAGFVSRLDHDDGSVVWHSVLDPEPPAVVGVSRPTAIDRRMFVSWACCRSGVGGSFVLDRRTGEVLGSLGGDGPFTDVAVAEGALATLVVAGSGAWQFTWGSREILLDGLSVDGFAIAGDRVLMNRGDEAVSFGPECRPSSDPAFSCEPDWRTDLGVSSSTPAAVGHDAVVYTGYTSFPSGTVPVLDTSTGAVRWRAEVGPETRVREPVVTRKTIVMGASGRVMGFRARGCGAAVCSPTWESPDLGASVNGLAAGGDVVYASTSSGVLAFAADGCGERICPPLATFGGGGDAGGYGPPIVHAGRVIVGTAQGHVVAFGLPRE